MIRTQKRIWSTLLALTVAGMMPATATVKLPRIFTPHMVLQRNKPVQLWGWADKGEKVTVEWQGKKLSTKTGSDGNWQVSLPAMQAGGPYKLVVQGKNRIELDDILIGDVYVCSGQSNMEWTMRAVNNSEKEVRDGNNPLLRLFTVQKATAFEPAADLEGGQWQTCTPEHLIDFSAVAYFFGRKLAAEEKIPIGLISSNWGGTNVQTWISWDVMGKLSGYTDQDRLQFKAAKSGMEQKLASFRSLLLENKGEKEKWFDGGGDWKPIRQPMAWEQSVIGNADGIVWMKKEWTLPASLAGNKARLYLGPIDDHDVTYVNGVKVGATDVYNKERVYELDASVLKPGKNLLVVKVTDDGGGGGLYGSPEQLYVEVAGERIPLAGDWQYRSVALTTEFGIQDVGPNQFPSQLFNAMIAPFIKMPIAGAIWYQGESNVGEAVKYRSLFPELIRNWRSKWNDEFPFMWVQLANFTAPATVPGPSDWAELREAQSQTLSLPRTGQAVIIDIGEAFDIHPRNKQDVGLRLALAAEKIVYDRQLVYSGPTYDHMEIRGNEIILHFKNTGSGLQARDRYAYLRGFTIAGADQRFVWAPARIEGNTVIVSAEAVKQPVAVRYAWANNPDDANLYNREGLPASSFRTDNWPVSTEGKSMFK
ncbi:MAG: sialate O-acetylesterase [Chitinophagaceae bacterium]|nr:sialate O-acetylesterase [Chitinophagaceae bacterium]